MKRLPLLIAFLIIIFYKPNDQLLASVMKKISSGVNIMLTSEIFPGRLFHTLPVLGL